MKRVAHDASILCDYVCLHVQNFQEYHSGHYTIKCKFKNKVIVEKSKFQNVTIQLRH